MVEGGVKWLRIGFMVFISGVCRNGVVWLNK